MRLDDPADQALLDLLRWLDASGYDFVTPTPETHARVLRRSPGPARDLRDVLGWSRLFAPEVVDAEVVGLLRRAGALEQADGALKSRLRVSRLARRLYLHSAFPTVEKDAVFLGPDSYRFAAFVARELRACAAGLSILDVGAGAGVGGVAAADVCPDARLTLGDVNPEALRLARINLAHAGLAAELAHASGLDGLDGPFDLIIANPPYMASTGRTYRDGGDRHGARLSLDWAIAGMDRLAPGGRVLLYTGSAIVGGEDQLKAALAGAAKAAGAHMRYEEIDPDVFGETVSEPGYEDVDRIAAVGCVLTRPG
jgi:methylase of polypeptide subunit release factors